MPGFNFTEAIFRQLHERSEAMAFLIADEAYSYARLSDTVAGIQSALGNAAGENYVGVYIRDDIQTYASILALWFLGKAFVPLNPLFPDERNRSIIGQVDLKAVLSSGPFPDALTSPGIQVIDTSLHGSAMPGAGARLIAFGRGKDAYVLFTSGSSGIPKGVRISFENLDAFIGDFLAYPSYSLGSEDRFLQIYDLSFDASVHCYALPLAIGASVFTVPSGGIKYLAAYKLMHEQGLSFVKMPPSTLAYLRPHFASIRLPHLKYCLFGGEAFPASLVEEWKDCVPNALIQNVYGPTEATINCLIYDWHNPADASLKKKEEQGVGSIGRAFGSNRVRIAGTERADAEAGAPGEKAVFGELLVGGRQITPAYWKRPDLDELAFEWHLEDGERHRYYRTGDIVRRDAEGDIMYIRRNDEQVQIRGYRVELGEIEVNAGRHLDGAIVMAAGMEDRNGNMSIYLAVEASFENPDQISRDLLLKLESVLPSYMLPAAVCFIPEFPKLVSGKLDRSKLREMIAERR